MSTGIAIRANGDTTNTILKTTESGRPRELSIRRVSSQAYELAHGFADGNQGFTLRALLDAVTTALMPISQTADWDGLSDPAWLGVYKQAARDFARMVEAVAEDATVYGKVSDDVLDLWVVVTQRSQIVETALAEAMCELMRAHPRLRFDFMIAERDCSRVDPLQESGYAVLGADEPTSVDHAV